MNIVRAWFRRYFSDPQVVGLALLLLGGVAAVLLLGHVLAPVIAGLVIAYVLDPSVQLLKRHRVPHGLAATLVSRPTSGLQELWSGGPSFEREYVLLYEDADVYGDGQSWYYLVNAVDACGNEGP